jgi:hypothetical protein
VATAIAGHDRAALAGRELPHVIAGGVLQGRADHVRMYEAKHDLTREDPAKETKRGRSHAGPQAPRS